ncbi:MAG TPA: alkaline phosphatase D family protein [Steroidobacteraceae bacterium]|nr:alkaline phosphatase D family protein [Steroidobacteraceae bacterium]
MRTDPVRALLAVLTFAATAALHAAETAPPLVIFGDPQPHSAVAWSRMPNATAMHVRVRATATTAWRKFDAPVTAANDFAAKVTLKGLLPATPYEYELWFTGGGVDENLKAAGRLRTAASDQSFVPVHFAWSGDLGGQNICRDAVDGYPIFGPLGAEKLDFFVALGDMVYEDNTCLPRGQLNNMQVTGPAQPAVRLEDYWGMWHYNRGDARFAEFIAHQPYVAVWDDHEVANDFGPGNDTRTEAPYTAGEHLLPLGLKAFLDENPLIGDASATPKLYRTFSYGLHAQVFVLDCRQFRSLNSAKDLASAPKTMLGADQLAWLLREVAKSKATWKIIITSVPLALQTGSTENGLDGWASFDLEFGYERELRKIVNSLYDNKVKNIVWLTTDVHFAAGFHYRPIDEDPTWEMHEFTSGPLNAQSFPKQTLDTTFNPDRLFFYGPAYVGEPKTWAQAKKWFNYGLVDIDRTGVLTVSIKNVDGEVVRQAKLNPKRK